MEDPLLPIVINKDVESSYVRLDTNDQVIFDFESSNLNIIDNIVCSASKGINDHTIVSSPEDSVCAMTSSYNGSFSGYWHVVRKIMINNGYDKSLTATTGDDLGVFTLKKRTYDTGIISGSLTATCTGNEFGQNFVGDNIADDYYDDGYGNLVRSSNGDKIGSVFLDEGMFVVTSSSMREVATSITKISFKTRVKHSNLNVFCKCQPNELNYTLNNTAASTASLCAFGESIENVHNSIYTKTSITSSTERFEYWPDLVSSGFAFSPMISSIGLYNDNNDLIAVAKLTRPVKKPTDLPITFRVSIDI